MFSHNLTEEQRLDKAVTKLLSEPRLMALAGVMMIGKKEIRDSIPTACTNGRDEMYGRRFVSGLSDKQLRSVVMHEVGHKMTQDIVTWLPLFKLDAQRANQAADYVVNLWIKDEIGAGVDAEFWASPPPLLDEKYRGMTVAEVFRKLPPSNGGSGGGGGGGGSGDGLEDHDWEGAQSMTEEEQRQLAGEIDTALRQGQIIAGKSGNASRAVEEILKSKVDWREALRNFVTEQCAGSDYTSWGAVNRRYIGSDVVMPATFSDSAGDLIVAIDTSGSIGTEILSKFLGHVQAVCEQVKPRSVRILYWDTKVCSDEFYSDTALDALVTSTRPKGGGGTDAACVPKYIQDKGYTPKGTLVLTDGYVVSWGHWEHPVMWCVVGSNKTVPPVGKVVHVE